MTITHAINPTIKAEVEDFIALLQVHNKTLQQVILFGSYAKSTEHCDSDIDLAVIADNFGKDEIEEMMELKKLALQVSSYIVPIPLTRKFMENKYHPLIGEIKKYGQLIYSKSN